MSKTGKKGFTLIEVSLAIVIGVIVLAGAITLYNQTKINAGNSKAGAKTAALATLIEEMMSTANGVQPNIAQVRINWASRRTEDFNISPWGGQLPAAISGIALQGGWGDIAAPLTSDVATAPIGAMVYASSSAIVGTAQVWDQSAGSQKPARLYWVGAVEPNGTQTNGRFPSYLVGGK